MASNTQSCEVFDGPDMWALYINGFVQQSWIKMGLKLDGKRHKVECRVDGVRQTHDERTWMVDFCFINFSAFICENHPPEWFVELMKKTDYIFRIRYSLKRRSGSLIPTLPDREKILVDRMTVNQLHLSILPTAIILMTNAIAQSQATDDNSRVTQLEYLKDLIGTIREQLYQLDQNA